MWEAFDVDKLTAIQAQALFLLTGAGMIDRQFSIRMRMFNHPVALEATCTATGEYGAVEALMPLVEAMWVEWQQSYRSWVAGDAKQGPSGYCERIIPEKWRLTDQGIIARKGLEADKQTREGVCGFVMKRRFFGGQSFLMPDGRIFRHESVRGRGVLVRMRKVGADSPPAEPLAVKVVNWPEGAKIIAELFNSLKLSEEAATTPAEPKPTHSADFTCVNWYGTKYTFALGVQASAVKALWDEWEKSGMELHQETIRRAVDAERKNFRMDKAFRNHPAFGTMIQRIGDGRYKLEPPTTAKPAPALMGKKSAKSPGIPAKARQKPR